ncbi:MAG TPA: immunity 26/phosphotriesterase HocA family protein [Polyangia bacterium]|nr:immunity 26/phosphotriesterase HocA family protein [Polyangia bacterium]
MPKINYREGDWFSVPLREGGFAVGVVARANPDGVLVGYFFGPRHDAAPTLDDVRDLKPQDAVMVGKFGHLGLTQRKWPVLGRVDGWNRADWPMPVFVRYEELSGRSFRAFYDDDDPNKLLREEQVSPGAAEQGPKDTMMGAGFVEKRLTSVLR